MCLGIQFGAVMPCFGTGEAESFWLRSASQCDAIVAIEFTLLILAAAVRTVSWVYHHQGLLVRLCCCSIVILPNDHGFQSKCAVLCNEFASNATA